MRETAAITPNFDRKRTAECAEEERTMTEDQFTDQVAGIVGKRPGITWMLFVYLGITVTIVFAAVIVALAASLLIAGAILAIAASPVLGFIATRQGVRIAKLRERLRELKGEAS
jgi:hypothetical protein